MASPAAPQSRLPRTRHQSASPMRNDDPERFRLPDSPTPAPFANEGTEFRPINLYDLPDSPRHSPEPQEGHEAGVQPSEPFYQPPGGAALLPFLPLVTSQGNTLQEILVDSMAEVSYLGHRIDLVRSQIRAMDNQLQAIKALETIRRAMESEKNARTS
jgi:hypothetical protein